ncbi:hypothetical protein [Streptomyces rubiginosohelvolus]|uniref:hypothetical protein n=1 Tax=Streptomyces rubiginosohelvolus TaxID=67362 RepID=UPI0036675E71
MSTRDENMVAALRRERAAYVAQGKDDRVEQVDDQLRRLGADPEPDKAEGPEDRTPADPDQQTADQTAVETAAAGGDSAAPVTETAPPAAAAKKAAAGRRSAAKE